MFAPATAAAVGVFFKLFKYLFYKILSMYTYKHPCYSYIKSLANNELLPLLYCYHPLLFLLLHTTTTTTTTITTTTTVAMTIISCADT
jgi:hypothetical protein